MDFSIFLSDNILKFLLKLTFFASDDMILMSTRSLQPEISNMVLGTVSDSPHCLTSVYLSIGLYCLYHRLLLRLWIFLRCDPMKISVMIHLSDKNRNCSQFTGKMSIQMIELN